MPAAAVIPAPLAYIKVAAVKKLVVGSRDRVDGFVASPCVSACGVVASRRPCRRGPHLWWGSTSLVQPAVAFWRVSLIGCPSRTWPLYLEQIGVLKAGSSSLER